MISSLLVKSQTGMKKSEYWIAFSLKCRFSVSRHRRVFFRSAFQAGNSIWSRYVGRGVGCSHPLIFTAPLVFRPLLFIPCDFPVHVRVSIRARTDIARALEMRCESGGVRVTLCIDEFKPLGCLQSFEVSNQVLNTRRIRLCGTLVRQSEPMEYATIKFPNSPAHYLKGTKISNLTHNFIYKGHFFPQNQTSIKKSSKMFNPSSLV